MQNHREWFQNCGGFSPSHEIAALRNGLKSGLLNEQDEYGMTALSLAVMSRWLEGVSELLQAGANTELRYFRTGETALYMAVLEGYEPIIADLVASGANPDAPNYWGLTPRVWAMRRKLSCFDQIPHRDSSLPRPHIQNAEHLADHFHPRFKIPGRKERESLQVGQAVDLYVFGPKADAKQDTVKVRIIATSGNSPTNRYVGKVETPIERTHLDQGTEIVEFDPEHVATVYVVK